MLTENTDSITVWQRRPSTTADTYLTGTRTRRSGVLFSAEEATSLLQQAEATEVRPQSWSEERRVLSRRQAVSLIRQSFKSQLSHVLKRASDATVLEDELSTEDRIQDLAQELNALMTRDDALLGTVPVPPPPPAPLVFSKLPSSRDSSAPPPPLPRTVRASSLGNNSAAAPPPPPPPPPINSKPISRVSSFKAPVVPDNSPPPLPLSRRVSFSKRRSETLSVHSTQENTITSEQTSSESTTPPLSASPIHARLPLEVVTGRIDQISDVTQLRKCLHELYALYRQQRDKLQLVEEESHQLRGAVTNQSQQLLEMANQYAKTERELKRIQATASHLEETFAQKQLKWMMQHQEEVARLEHENEQLKQQLRHSSQHYPSTSSGNWWDRWRS